MANNAWIFVMLILAPGWCLGEVYNCGGTWQSKPCPGQAQTVLEEQSRPERSQADKDLDTKKLWLHDLEMRVLKVKRATGIEARSAPAREICTREESSLIDCSRAISEVEVILIDYMLERSGDGESHSSAGAQERVVQQVEQNSTVVYVDNSQDLVVCDPLRSSGCRENRVVQGVKEKSPGGVSIRETKAPAVRKPARSGVVTLGR